MWSRELASATIAAQIVGMEEFGRQSFEAYKYGDADVILIDESHNFRNDKSNRYLALDTLIQYNGGRGRDGEPKKVILLSATPINNDLYDIANQIRLFTQGRPDYFREAGIGDLNAYFRQEGKTAPGRCQALDPRGPGVDLLRVPDLRLTDWSAGRLIKSLRAVMLEGATLLSLWPEVAILAGWGVVTFLLALRWFRWN
jgi:hypothetical protein